MHKVIFRGRLPLGLHSTCMAGIKYQKGSTEKEGPCTFLVILISKLLCFLTLWQGKGKRETRFCEARLAIF